MGLLAHRQRLLQGCRGVQGHQGVGQPDKVGDRPGLVGSPHQGDVLLQFGNPSDHVRSLRQLAAVVAVTGLGGGILAVRAPGPGLGERLLAGIDESGDGSSPKN